MKKLPISKGLVRHDDQIIGDLMTHLKEHYPRLHFEPWVKLKDIFPKPEGGYLRSIWQYGEADIAVKRHGEIVCILEPGGWYHAKDKIQKERDKKKDILCRKNGVNCLRFYNGMVGILDKKETRRLFKKFFYSNNNK